MKKLIVNADGFGFTRGINRGIIESIKKGIVTSTSCNVNFDAINDVVQLFEVGKPISIGLHLNVNVGKPVSDCKSIPSLLNPSGEFWGASFQKRYFSGKIKLNEIEKELEAQILKIQQLGVDISHLDGHQNKHLYPGYFGIVMRLADKYGIKRIRCHRRYMFTAGSENRKAQLTKYYMSHPQRLLSQCYSRVQMKRAEAKGIKMADRLITPAYLDNSYKYQLDTWLRITKVLPEGISEIYCHPGYADDELRRYATYVDQREDEIKVMTDPRLLEAIENAGIKLISFHEV